MRGPFDILLTSRRGDQELVLKLTSSITLILQSELGLGHTHQRISLLLRLII